jgi:hypothetical protein
VLGRGLYIFVVVAVSFLGTGVASARATVISATVNGDPVATRPISVTVSVSGARTGDQIITSLLPAAPGMVSYPNVDPTQCPHDDRQFGYPVGFWGDDQRSISQPDFTFTTALGEADIAGPLRLCVFIVAPPGPPNYGWTPPLAASSTTFDLRAPRGTLRMSRVRWNARSRRLTFRYAGSSESTGQVRRFLVRSPARCPARVPNFLDQTPADLGSGGPPDRGRFAGRFSFTVRVRWRGRLPPAGRYRVCAYLISDAGTTQLHYSLIQMARTHAPVRIRR